VFQGRKPDGRALRRLSNGFSQTQTLTAGGNYVAVVVGENAGTVAGFSVLRWQAAQSTVSVLKAGTGHGTITASPGDISCGSDCWEAFKGGTQVKLTAKADAKSLFEGWSGDCADTSPSTSVTAGGNISFKATLDANAN
jgi:uncharacterized repeat protein (TIGR02543 family)